MSRNISASADLASKYAVGEIVDMVGVPDYYDAGSSKWMRSGTWVTGAPLSASVRETLSARSDAVALTANTLLNEQFACLNVTNQAVVGSVACYPYSSAVRGSSAWVLRLSSDGPELVNTGARTLTPANVGGTQAVVSDGTKFWSFVLDPYTNLYSARSSTDGKSWNSETISGLSTSGPFTDTFFAGGGSNYNSLTAAGENFDVNASSFAAMVAWCGARFIFLTFNSASNFFGYTSTNGLVWTSALTPVFGGTAPSSTTQVWYYRNGNNFFFHYGDTSKFSSDGGVTWTDATNAITGTSNGLYRINSTDPARLSVIKNSNELRISTNSGQTWATITPPGGVSFSQSDTSIFGRGSTWIAGFTATGTFYITTNDGASWSPLNTPVGFGSIQGVLADANRWYMVSGTGNQVATSTDGVTWTIRNISNQPTPGIANSTQYRKVLTIGDNIIITSTASNLMLTSNNGGVTWRWVSGSSASTSTLTVQQYAAANTAGTDAFLFGGNGGTSAVEGTSGVILSSEVTQGGASFRTGSTVVSPIRTNALAYSRVA